MEIKYKHEELLHNTKAPREVLPFVVELLSPHSVIDIGCGIGTWLAVLKDLGVDEVLGVDGEYVDGDLLANYLIKKEFIPHDLTLPFTLERRFDLCLCLEVAEHLPMDFSDTLIRSIVDHADVILFSAAIPGQGGQNHMNEQWPDYWANKFSKHGYVFLDLIRPLIWDNPEVDFWYKQNIFLVVRSNHELVKKYPSSCLSLVHPELLRRKEEAYQKRISSLERNLAVHPLRRWVKSIFK
jgi:SAM-dependent methyltransferase